MRGINQKTERREAVRELIAMHRITSQSDLGRRLTERGFETTQASLSRDLKALHVAKVIDLKGYFYVLPDATMLSSVPPLVGTTLRVIGVEGTRIICEVAMP
jgi:arginine repressor